MKLNYTWFIIALFLLLINCKKDEEIITGEIAGKIYTYDQYSIKLVPDQSGVKVKLFRDTALLSVTETDSRGQYGFGDLPYGKYKISLEKNLFIQSWDKKTVYHAGGYSPTLANYGMYEIPTYVLTLDSLGDFDAEDNRMIIYLKFNGDTTLPSNYGMPLLVFAGNSPEVSKDNYVSAGKSFLSVYGPEDLSIKTAVYGSLYEYNMDQNFDQLKNGLIYLRLYPIAMGQGYWINDYYPGALGPPSNVISFRWDEVVGKR